MCDFMMPAMTKDFSKLDLYGKKKVIVGSLRTGTRSDNIIEAAWDVGIGVHALIWVCYAQR
jgi:hypothetical protein